MKHSKKIKRIKMPLLILIFFTFTLVVGCDKSPSTIPTTTASVESTTESTTVNDTKGDLNALYAAYQLIDNQKMYGFMNLMGEFIIEPSYSYVSDFSEGLAITYDNTIYRVIDTTGQTVFENKGLIEPYKNGAAIYTDFDTYKRGFVDVNGQILTKPIYITIENFNSDGTALVSQTDGTFEIIDKSGQTINTFDVDTDYGIAYDTKDGFAVFMHQSNDFIRMGVISLADHTVIIEPNYNGIINLGEGFFAVNDPANESYDTFVTPAALFDRAGKQLSDYVYFDVSPFHDGLASATDDNSTFFIDATGKKVETLPIIEGRGTLLKIGDVIRADIDGNLSYLDEDGNIIWEGDNTRALTDSLKITENIYKPARLISIKYPTLTGLEDAVVQSKINETLYEKFAYARSEEYLNHLSVDDSFSARMIGELLIIAKDGYDYPSGAAHGMPVQEYYHIDLKTGAFYTFKDLFKANSDFSETLTEMIKVIIQKRVDDGDSFLFPESFTELSEDANFVIDEAHLTVYFYPYDIAAYAAGFQYFEIPYADITDYIDTEGELWKSFND